jgi:zinc-ribbon domain
LICPKCGEDNSDNFRFCGMCGTLLEARRPAGAPVPNLPPAVLPRIADDSEPLEPFVAEDTTRPPNEQSSATGGPLLLGLNQPGAKQPIPNQPGPNQSNIDSLGEKAFSGFDSFFEPEQPKTGGRRILLLVVLLAALGGAGWWTYANYLGAAEDRKPTAQSVAPTADPGSSQAAVPSAAVPPTAVPQGGSENAGAGPDSAQSATDAEAKSAPEKKPLTPAPVTPPAPPAKIAPREPREHAKIAAKRDPDVTSPKASNVPAPAAADTGDAAFRKGEAYLYGRGMPENCDEAVKYLKAASAKSNAKARSAFGTMYATGHCVARDLPTSYLWFAMALKVDPNNRILEKDLSAIWNQMTPPERQMAMRMKQ